MQMQFTPNNKLASLGTIGLLFLAGIAGMVFLLPYNSAHAATPTVTVSTLTSGVLTAAPSGTVGSTVVITGTAFSPAKAVTITTAVGAVTVAWLTLGTCATANGGTSGTDSLVVSGCLTTTATGNFQVSLSVPALPGGPQTITVSDGTNSGTASFSITAKLAFAVSGTTFGFPEQNVGTGTFTATGFGAAESLTVASTAFTAASFGSPSITTSNVGSGTTTASNLIVADTNGGSKAVTATGATSGLTASTTYTVNPWAAFYNSATGTTAFSFLGNAPTSLLIEAHGLPSGAIAANSITVGGVATSHSAITVGSTGGFGGAGGQLVVSPSSNVPFGPANVVIGGTTFSYAAGNIATGAAAWSGVLISSIAGSAGAGTGVALTDASSYKPGGYTASTTSPAPQTSEVGIFGYGFVNANTASVTSPAGATLSVVGTSFLAVGPNGAFFETASLADTPWSSAGAPTVAASYLIGVTEPSGPANILAPSFGITPFDKIGTSTVDYTTATEVVTVHGFGATDAITVTIAGTAMVSGGTCTVGITTGTCATASSKVPDLAGGKQNVVVTGSITGTTVTTTGGVTYDPIVNFASGNSLSINSGGAGQTTILRTGNGYGVHGLLASTAYTLWWNAISGSINVGTFTSTSTGGIPIPGVQFTIPSDSSGIHILDLTSAGGATALFGGQKAGEVTPTESPFSSADTTAYGDMLFNNIALLSSSPSVAVIGAPEAISGSGLSAGGAYVIALSAASGSVSTSAPALGTFTATAAGSVPAGTSISLTDTASTTETGTIMYFQIQTTAHFGVVTTPDATAQFVLAASANLNMTSAPAGHGVTITAHALNAGGAVYNIIFNYVQSPFSSTSFTGTPVGVIAPNSVGAGSASFNIPANAQAGTYPLELTVSSAGTGGLATGNQVLDTPLAITVGGTTGTCTNEGTACMGISGTPSVSKSGGNTLISATYTNNSNQPQTAYIYAVVHNALGQTVLYTTATVSPAAGGSQTGQLVLFGLAPGSYSATVFVVSSSGTALSTPTTVSVTV